MENKHTLREIFKSQTDIEINSENITKYEKWLETLNIIELNSNLIMENRFLKNQMEEALEILYNGLSETPK